MELQKFQMFQGRASLCLVQIFLTVLAPRQKKFLIIDK